MKPTHKGLIVLGGTIVIAIIGGIAWKIFLPAPLPAAPHAPAVTTSTVSMPAIPPDVGAATSSQNSANSSTAPVSAKPVPVKTNTTNPIGSPPVAGQNATATSTASGTISQTTPQGDPPEISIDPQVIVGILCYYDVTLTSQETGASESLDSEQEVRGSGVIVDSKGDILTNRHIVVQPEATATVTDSNGNPVPVTVDYTLNRCEVGQLPKDAHLPTPDEIQSINPYVQVPVLGYTAEPAYISQTAGLSDAEMAYADFAILRITGVSKNGPTFGITSVPSSFPYAQFLPVKSYSKIDGLVITYGFPGDITEGQGNFFETMTMTGSIGHVTAIDVGDRYYADTPLVIYTDMEIYHGRSGSPLFWRGYVIGIITFYENGNRTDSGSVATDAIIKGLQFSNYNLSQ